MKRISVTALLLLFSAAFVFGGCGKKEKDSAEKEDVALQDAEEGDFEEESGADEEEQDAALEDTEHFSDVAGVAGSAVQLTFEGETAGALNGKIAAIAPCQTDCMIAQTTDGNLFLVKPDIEVYLKQFEAEAHQITDSGSFDGLIYADGHTACGQESVAYFEMREDYSEEALNSIVDEDPEDIDIEAYYDALKQMVFVFDNLQETKLADADGVILVSEDADFCAYADKSGKVCADYRDSVNGDKKPYTTFSGVRFTGDGNERDDVEVKKAIYRFVLTKDNEVLLVREASTAVDFGGQVQDLSLVYTDLSVADKIDSPIKDIFNVRLDEDYCYAVDEENRIWYVGYSWLDDGVTAEQVAQLPDGLITDVQGFSGTHETVLVGMEDGSWYYTYYDGLQKVDGLDGSYRRALNISDESVVALGDDGYLYSVGL